MKSSAVLLVLAAIACSGPPAPIAPVGMRPVAANLVDGWVRASRFTAPTSVTYSAVLPDVGKGRGTISILPGDSLRFDFRGPLGMGRSAAAVVGDSALWAEPKEDVAKVVPSYPLLWAMVGVARRPRPGEALVGLQSGPVTAWQYRGPADTVTYVRTATQLRAEVRRDGKLFGQVTTTFGPDGVIRKSSLLVTDPKVRLEVTYSKVLKVNGFPKEIWDAPNP